MSKIVCKKIVAAVIALSVACTSFPLNPGMGQRAQAAGADQVISLGTSRISAPSLYGTRWQGDYVYYGKYGNVPVKWRVLDTTGNGGSSSVQGGLLLQSDQVLASMPFEDGTDSANVHQNGKLPNNQWNVSDIRSWLQGSGSSQFLSSNNFSAVEKAGIMRTTRMPGNSPLTILNSVGLEGDTMFLLDAGDIANTSYGYQYTNGLTDGSIGNFWWLRSSHARYSDVVGSVLSGGYVYYDFTPEMGGVVPAFNLNASNVLFISAADGIKNTSLETVASSDVDEWKLTLLDHRQNVEVAGDITRDGDDINIPYSYKGTGANQLSVMITGTENVESGDDGGDGPEDESPEEEDDDAAGYAAGGRSAGKKNAGSRIAGDGEGIKYYGKVSDGEVTPGGSISFSLPEGYNEETDTVYLFAEQVNGQKETDYAGSPVEIGIPPLHTHQWQEAWSYDQEAHWHECTAPNCDIAENEEKEDYEEHEWDDGVVTKQATCTEGGEMLYSCEVCGYSTVEETDPEHDFGEDEEWIITKSPTWDQEGEQKIQCLVCGEWVVESIPSLSEEHKHEYVVETLQEPTCVKPGWKRTYCTTKECGDSYEEDIPPLGHSFGEWKVAVEPTAEKEGEYRRTCAVCGTIEIQSIAKLVPEHTHDYHEDQWITDEDCHWNQCQCGEIENLEEHAWNKGTVLRAATRNAEGEIRYRCTVCGITANYVMAKIGTRFSKGIYQYQVIKGKNNRPAVTTLGFAKGKSAKVINMPKTVTLNNVGYAVCAVFKKAFFKDKGIRKIKLNDNIETIGNYAFFRAANVENITIGTGMKDLGEHTFCHMKKLEAIVIKSKKLKEATGFDMFHGMNRFDIKVPKGRVKKYQKKVFYNHPQNVKAMNE